MMEKKKDDRLNIIWVFPDQMRGHATSSSGDVNVHTPNLDRMANEGVRFTSACSSYPVCVPFRFTMLTGESASSRWIPTIHWRMSPAERTIADILNENGYQTAYVGKWHLYGGEYAADYYKSIPIPRCNQGGFQRWKGFELRNNHFDTWYYCEDDPEPRKIEGYQCDELFDIAMNEIEEMINLEEPFFLALSVETPHPPYHGPDFIGGKRDDRQISFRENVDVERLKKNMPWLFSKSLWGHSQFKDADIEILKGHLAEYYASIENVDKNLGRLIEKLEYLGILESTVIMFFSDHGELLGCHGLQGKQWPYEESINIPFIVKIPERIMKTNDIKKDMLISSPIHTEDIFPTTLGFAGIKVPDGKPGKNLVPWMTQVRKPDREGVFLEYVAEHRDSHKQVPPWRAYRTEKHKYVITLDGPYMLFDIQKDPFELENVINNEKYEMIRSKMHKVLMQHLKDNDNSFYYAYAHNVGKVCF